MFEQRFSLIEARRQAAAKAKLQKEAITRVMEDVRSSAAKANKVVNLVKSGGVSLEELVGSNSMLSPGKVRKKKDKIKTSMELLGMNRGSQSAGAQAEVEGYDAGFAFQNEEEPRRYVSPYESGFKPTSAT